MKAVTIRHIPASVAQFVRQRAVKEHTSINKTVISLLAERAGLASQKRALHHDLDHLSGAWTKAEAKGFETTLASQRSIDPDLWK